MKLSYYDSIVQKWIDKIAESVPVTDYELAALLEGSLNRRHALVKRAMAKNELLKLRRGLYVVPPRKGGPGIDKFSLAQHIYGPSYISLHSALAYQGWIPEAVYTVTSVCSKRSCEFRNPLGVFSYSRVPSASLFAGVSRIVSHSGQFLIADPLKALADYAYVYKKLWKSWAEASADLRIELRIGKAIKVEQLEELIPVFGSARVRTFLKRLRKEISA